MKLLAVSKVLVCLSGLILINTFIWYSLTTPRPTVLIPMTEKTGTCVQRLEATQGENFRLFFNARLSTSHPLKFLTPPLEVNVTQGSAHLATVHPETVFKGGEFGTSLVYEPRIHHENI